MEVLDELSPQKKSAPSFGTRRILVFHINQIETTFVKFFDFGFDNVMISTRQIKKHNKQLSFFADTWFDPQMILPHCQSNPQGVDFLCTFLESYTWKLFIFHAGCLRWGEFLVKFHDVPPKAWQGVRVRGGWRFNGRIGWWKLWLVVGHVGKWQSCRYYHQGIMEVWYEIIRWYQNWLQVWIFQVSLHSNLLGFLNPKFFRMIFQTNNHVFVVYSWQLWILMRLL